MPNRVLCRACAPGPWVPLEITCDCGVAFMPNHHSQRFCSKACQRYARREREGVARVSSCSVCGTDTSRVVGNGRYVGKFCGERCREVADRRLEFGRVVRERRAWLRRHEARKGEWWQCLCGEPFLRFGPRKYCSDVCKYAANQVVFVEYWDECPCVECGKMFQPYNSRSRFCSRRCSRRFDKRVDRHRKRAAVHVPYAARDVFERDKWMCQLCGERVDSGLDPQDDWAASLDHIVPLSLGGDDVAANVQLAHRMCNSLKGTSAVGSQLRLVG